MCCFVNVRVMWCYEYYDFWTAPWGNTRKETKTQHNLISLTTQQFHSWKQEWHKLTVTFDLWTPNFNQSISLVLCCLFPLQLLYFLCCQTGEDVFFFARVSLCCCVDLSQHRITIFLHKISLPCTFFLYLAVFINSFTLFLPFLN